MGWLSLFSGAIKLVNILAGILERRGLVDQGRALQAGESNADVLATAQKAMAARRAVPKYMAGDKLSDDPHRRD